MEDIDLQKEIQLENEFLKIRKNEKIKQKQFKDAVRIAKFSTLLAINIGFLYVIISMIYGK